jgi:hypothetical protein
VSVAGVTLLEGENNVTVTARDEADNQSSAFLTITYTTTDTTAPEVAITSPTSAASWTTGTNTLNLSGTASDNKKVTEVAWQNSRGGGGTASGTDTWSIAGIELSEGENRITVTAKDSAGNTAFAAVSVTYAFSLDTVYEDSENGNIAGWTVYDNYPAGATIRNVTDADRGSRVIQVSGSGTSNGYRLRNDNGSAWGNTDQFVLEWSMRFSENFTIYIDLETSLGNGYIVYEASDTDRLGTGTYVYFGIGSDAKNGAWRTFERDLQADLAKAYPTATITKVNGFLVRGSGSFDDIKLKR